MRCFLTLALAALVACSDAPDAGESCTHDAECPGEARCLGVGEEGLRLCLPACDPATTVLCSEAEQGLEGACIALGEGGACYPGGAAAVGEACERSIDCALAALCILDGGLGTCRSACDLTAPDCGAGEVCSGLGEGIRGYCAP